MSMEIIVAIIAGAFVILVVFIIMTLLRLRRVLKKTERLLGEATHLLHNLSAPSTELIQHTNKLVLDIKKKSEGLDVLFHPLYTLKKEHPEERKGYSKICELLEYVIEGVQLFSKIKKEMK